MSAADKCNQDLDRGHRNLLFMVLTQVPKYSSSDDFLTSYDFRNMLKFSETKVVAFFCSGVACIWVDTSCGENEIVIVAGANESLASSHVEAASNVISGARALGVSLEANREGVLTAMRIAKVYSLNKI